MSTSKRNFINLIKKKKGPPSSFFFLIFLISILIFIFGFFKGRTHKKQWLDSEEVVYIYTNTPELSRDDFNDFVKSERIQVVLYNIANIDLKKEIETFHQNSLFILDHKLFKEAKELQSLFCQNPMPVSKKIDLQFTDKEVLCYVPLFVVPLRKEIIQIAQIIDNENKDSIQRLIQFLYTRQFQKKILIRHPHLMTVLKEFNQDNEILSTQKSDAFKLLKWTDF